MASDRMVVLDVDDTLYLERDYVACGFRAVAPLASSMFGATGFDAAAWRLFEDGLRGDIFNRALHQLGVSYTADQVGVLVDAYRRHSPDIALLDDARAAIDVLARDGWRFGVLTDGPTICQANKVAALGLHEFADIIVLTDEYGPGFGKPHPRGYQDIARCSGARQLVYVADNPRKDFVAPSRLGWTTVRIRRPGGLHARVPHGDDVDHVVDDLRQLPTALNLGDLHDVSGARCRARVKA